MKHLKTLSSYYSDPIGDKIREYISDNDNFPEMDNIKSIFEDFKDLCFIKSITSPRYDKEILRIDDKGKIKYLTGDREITIREPRTKNGKHILRPEDVVKYYKSYRVTIQIKNKNNNEDFNLEIDKTCKRLENYGFIIKKESTINSMPLRMEIFSKNEIKFIVIYIIDPNDPITLTEILNPNILNRK